MFRRKAGSRGGADLRQDEGDGGNPASTSVHISGNGTHGQTDVEPEIKPKSKAYNAFTQQKLHAWQPSLSPKGTIAVLIVTGLVLLTLGCVILITATGIVECAKDYSGAALGQVVSVEITKGDCSLDKGELNGDIFLYYELTRFYQNHRRYLKSRSESQLQGEILTSLTAAAACEPIISDSTGKIKHPCGLGANAVFTDTYELLDSSGNLIDLDESQQTITWKTDLGNRYKNPSDEAITQNEDKVDFWLWKPEWRERLNMDKEGVGVGVENSHFMVWMRNAALPDFRKLFAKVQKTSLELPVTVRINNRYDVGSYEGTKSIVLSESTWIGGRNLFLGIAYIVVGSICLFVGALFFFYHRKSPRRVGDIAWLRRGLQEG